MISYCITVYNEIDYIKNLIDNLVSVKTDDEEIVVIQTHKDPIEKEQQWYKDINDYLRSKNIPEHLYHFDGNFSNLKNHMNSLATKTYIFNLDADENMRKEAFPLIRQIINETNLDLYLFPRVNTVSGLTDEDIQRWSWKINDRGWVNWPDFQPRLYKNNDKIKWVGDVHERIEGNINYGTIVEDELLAIIHHKDIERQRAQNQYYETFTNKQTEKPKPKKHPISISYCRTLIGLCSWNNPQLLKWCVSSLIKSIDTTKDRIAVVLNEGDRESIDYLHKLNIPFIYNPENSGPLAIDFLKGYIERSDYFMNSNDDMIFHPGFLDDLISIIESHYPATASCGLVEYFNSNNPSVVVDSDLNTFNNETIDLFLTRYNEQKYARQSLTYGYNHPILCKSKDVLSVGGYAGNWNMNFLSGYGRDDAFPYELWKNSCKQYKFIMSAKSVVLHLSSYTNNKLPIEYRQTNHNQDNFARLYGVSLAEFRQKIIKIGDVVS